MDASTWANCYEKLIRAYQKPRDEDQAKLYFSLLANVPGPVIRLAIDKCIKEETYWPNPATVRDYCDGATKDISLPANRCRTCEGTTWVAAPDQEHFGLTYRYVDRCPQCWTLTRTAAPEDAA